MSHREKIKEKVEKDKSGDYGSFYQSVIGLGLADLKQNILMYQKHLQETMVAMKTNETILNLENEKRIAEKPYKDKIKEFKDKIKQLKSFVDKSICVPDLEQQIILYTVKAEEQKQKMSEDPIVFYLKDELKNLKSPFNEAKEILETKISYLSFLLEENGYISE